MCGWGCRECRTQLGQLSSGSSSPSRATPCTSQHSPQGSPTTGNAPVLLQGWEQPQGLLGFDSGGQRGQRILLSASAMLRDSQAAVARAPNPPSATQTHLGQLHFHSSEQEQGTEPSQEKFMGKRGSRRRAPAAKNNPQGGEGPAQG